MPKIIFQPLMICNPALKNVRPLKTWGFVIPPIFSSSLFAADSKSADPKKVGSFFIRRISNPAAPEGGEQEQGWMWFAPFGDAFSLLLVIRRFHDLRSFHQRLLKVGPLRGPEVTCEN